MFFAEAAPTWEFEKTVRMAQLDEEGSHRRMLLNILQFGDADSLQTFLTSPTVYICPPSVLKQMLGQTWLCLKSMLLGNEDTMPVNASLLSLL